jgi:hypothetical protein
MKTIFFIKYGAQKVSCDATAVQYFLYIEMFQKLHFQKEINIWFLELLHWQVLLMSTVTGTKFF